MEFLAYLVIIILIFLATFLTSLGGLGAAFIIIPLLLLYGYTVELASIMGLSFNFINTLTASSRHYRHHYIDFRISIPIILVSFIGAPTGALLVNYIPSKELKLVFALVLIAIGSKNISKLYGSNNVEVDAAEPLEEKIQHLLLLSVIVGFFVGFVSGLLGIGGGALVLPLLLYFGFPAKKAAGTTSFIVVFSSLVGVISKLLINEYDIDYILLYWGIGVSVLGALLGSYAMHLRLRQSQIKLIISGLIIAVGLKMVTDYFR
jgi:uncharacterized membrane protein YfcA